jgi:hypothetical protein
MPQERALPTLMRVLAQRERERERERGEEREKRQLGSGGRVKDTRLLETHAHKPHDNMNS